MSNETAILVASNCVTGFSFMVVPICALWLYIQRQGDWPKAWALLVIAIAVGGCGVSRFLHAIVYYQWPRVSPQIIVVSDVLAAVGALLGAVFIPWAVVVLRKVPPLKEIESALESKWEQKQLSRERERMRQESKRIARQKNILMALLSQTPIPTTMKDEIGAVLRELPSYDIPDSVPAPASSRH